MSDFNLAFIGGGNMTRAIVAGLLESGFAPDRIWISEPIADQRAALADDFRGVFVTGDNAIAAAEVDCVVLAVKPQVLPEVCRGLVDTAQEKQPLVISIAAGLRSDDIDAWLGGGLAVVRVMPNQPALLRQGVSGVYANERTSKEQLARAEEILSAIGKVVVVPTEGDIDAVTAVSGSGPAYVYLLIDMMMQAGIELGLDADSSRILAIETAKGAAALADASDETLNSLIARVRSPGGTTAAALDSLDQSNVRAIFSAALTAARERAVELADKAAQNGQ